MEFKVLFVLALCVVCSMANPVPSDAPAPVPDQEGQNQFLLPYYGYPYVATYKTAPAVPASTVKVTTQPLVYTYPGAYHYGFPYALPYVI